MPLENIHTLFTLTYITTTLPHISITYLEVISVNIVRIVFSD